MMASVREYVRDWRARHPDLSPVADLGSYDINGNIRDILPVTGFDILPGKGVDVVITPGFIPLEHCARFQAVLTLDSFPYDPQPLRYIGQIRQLMATGGHLLLIACTEGCTTVHGTSPNGMGHTDQTRWTQEQFDSVLGEWFDGRIITLTDRHRIAYEGVLR